jgi:rod shape-determining protein MreC
MRNLLTLLFKYRVLIVFLILQLVALRLMISNLNYHKSKYLSASNKLFASVNEKRTNLAYYFLLQEENEILAQQNALLFQQKFNVAALQDFSDTITTFFSDSLPYQLISGRVINSTVNLPQNFLTLNIGSKHGVEPEMGVISENGVVGIVKGVSKHYSTVIPLINNNLTLSLAIKRNNFFGFYEWPGKNYRLANLNDIPFHVDIFEGDTLVTRGNSGTFPPDVQVAIVSNVNNEPGRNYQQITIELLNDFKKLNHIYVVKNALKEEQQLLEEQFN